jgi:hypothetical protein
MDSTTQIGFARRSRDRPFTLYGNSTHLTLRRHFTFHQQRFNSSYPSRQFPIPLKVTIALEIFAHNKPYFIHCRKKKLLAFPDLDSIQLFTYLWRNYPIFGYFKISCHF